MSEYRFTCIDEDGNTTERAVYSGEDDTWWPLLYQFFLFLQGCGFQLDPDKLTYEGFSSLAMSEDLEGCMLKHAFGMTYGNVAGGSE